MVEKKKVTKKTEPAKKAAAPAKKKAASKAAVTSKKAAAPMKTAVNKPKLSAEERLADLVVACMQEKKGENIARMDLRKAAGANFDWFVICEAQSGAQVRAIADEISDKVYAQTGEDPLHTEGYANGEWILLDYGNVLAHVFQREVRQHYRLEELWGDAVLNFIKDED